MKEKRCPSVYHESLEILSSTDFYRDKIRKDGLDTMCKVCRNKIRRNTRRKNVDKYKQLQQSYLQNGGKEVVADYGRQYYKANHEMIRKAAKNWRLQNPEKRQAQARIDASRRRDGVKKATPEWCDREKVRTIYQDAILLQRKTGIEYHVDHIVPLHGKYVCGLHCEDNLQILLAETNLKKSNTHNET